TFTVPPGEKTFDAYSPGTSDPPNLPTTPKGTPRSEFRDSPEYVHIRTLVDNGDLKDLNDLPDAKLTERLNGSFTALHYVDGTGDGWVDVAVDCPALSSDKRIKMQAAPAYLLQTAPDFFPSCDQRQLIEWTESNKVPPVIRRHLWNYPPDRPPDSL